MGEEGMEWVGLGQGSIFLALVFGVDFPKFEGCFCNNA
jgi:hypothetical protein